METPHATFTLSCCQNGNISKCDCCASFFLAYNNIFLTFPCKEALLALFKVLKELNDENFVVKHPHGLKALLKTNQCPGQIGFSKPEAYEIITMIQEALIIDETLDIIN